MVDYEECNMATRLNSSLWQRPRTRLGRWAAGLAVAFVVMFIINSAVFMSTSQDASNVWWGRILLPLYGIFMLLCGLTAGGWCGWLSCPGRLCYFSFWVSSWCRISSPYGSYFQAFMVWSVVWLASVIGYKQAAAAGFTPTNAAQHP